MSNGNGNNYSKKDHCRQLLQSTEWESVTSNTTNKMCLTVSHNKTLTF